MLAYETWQVHIKMAEEAERQKQLPVASAAYQLALIEAENIEGGQDVKAYTLLKLARVTWRLGNKDQAEAEFLKAVNTAQSGDLVISASHDLAKLYYQKQDKDSTKSFYEYALQVVSCQNGAESKQYFSLEKEYHDAMRCFDKRVPEQTGQTDSLPVPVNTILADWTFALEEAESKHRAGEFEKSREHCLKALKIAELIGKQTETYLETLHRVASLCACQGLDKEAERHLLASYGTKLGLYGANSVAVAETTQELAILYFNSGDLRKAEPWAKRTADIFEAATTGDTRELACALHNLAVLYHSLEDYVKAEPYYQRALYMKQNLFGNADLETINLMRGYADLLRKTHRRDEAEQLENSASGVLSGAWNVQDRLDSKTEEYIPSL